MTPSLSNRLGPVGRVCLAALLSIATLALGCGDDDGSSDGSADGGGSGEPAWSCERGCELTLEADCPMGPPSQAQCVTDCEDNLAGDCGAAYEALMRCAEGEAITCRDDGFVVIVACSAEQDAFVSCLN
jgi:hypothetical protein